MAAKKPTTKKPATKKAKPSVQEEPKVKGTGYKIETVGNPDMFQVLSSAIVPDEGLSRAILAMEVRGGCVMAVTTRQENPDGSYSVSDALTFVPNVWINDDVNGGKKLTQPKW